MTEDSGIYSFGPFELDTRTEQLRRDGAEVPLQRRVFSLLLFLIENRDRILTKDELQDVVWADTVVTETALTRAVMKARKALGDDGAEQQWIRTQHGRGYRFVGEVEQVGSATAPEASPATPTSDAPADSANVPTETRPRRVLRVVTAYGAFVWMLNQAAALAWEAWDWPAEGLQLLLSVTVLGALPVAAIAWTFVLTDHGLRRADRVAPGDRPVATTWLSASAILMLSIALAISLYWNLRTLPATEAPADTTVVVLPFDVPDGANTADLGEGFALALRDAFGAVPDLSVLARISSAELAEDPARLTARAQALGVTHLVEGSVSPAGAGLEVRVALLAGTDGTQLWSERFSAPADELIALRERVSRATVQALAERVAGIDGVRAEAGLRSAALRGTENLEAFRAYLEATRERLARSRDSLQRARDAYRRALDLDPAYARAWSGLSITELTLALFGVGERAQGMAAAREAAHTAIAYDGNLSLPWRVLAEVELRYTLNLPQAAAHMETALDLAPRSPDVMAAHASILSKLGRQREAAALAERAWRLDPLNVAIAATRTTRLMRADRLDEAAVALDELLKLAPTHGDRHWLRAQLALAQGDPATAIEAIAADELEYLRLTVTAIARHQLGDAAGSDADLQRLVETDAAGAAFQIAEIHAARGELDDAVAWLERAFEQRDPGVAELLSTPSLRALDGDPRFEAFRARLGF